MIDPAARREAEDKVMRTVDALSEGERLLAYIYLRNAYRISTDGIEYKIEDFFKKEKSRT